MWLFNLWPLGFVATLWSLGVAMLVLALLVQMCLGPGVIAAFGAVLVAGHNAFDFLDLAAPSGLSPAPSGGSFTRAG